MHACMHVCIHDVGKLLMNQQRTCCLIDKWAQERKRARERLSLREKREIRQSWLKSIVAVQVFVCTCASLSVYVYVYVWQRVECVKKRGQWRQRQSNNACLACLPSSILCGILECPSIFSSRGDFYVAVASLSSPLHLTRAGCEGTPCI